MEFRARPSRDWVSMENGFERLAVWCVGSEKVLWFRYEMLFLLNLWAASWNDSSSFKTSFCILSIGLFGERIAYVLWRSRHFREDFSSLKFLFDFERRIFFLFRYPLMKKILSREREIWPRRREWRILRDIYCERRDSPFVSNPAEISTESRSVVLIIFNKQECN